MYSMYAKIYSTSRHLCRYTFVTHCAELLWERVAWTLHQSCDKIHTIDWKALKMRTGYPLLLDKSRQCRAPSHCPVLPLHTAQCTAAFTNMHTEPLQWKTVAHIVPCISFFPVLTPFLSTNCLLLRFHQFDMPLQNTSTTPGSPILH